MCLCAVKISGKLWENPWLEFLSDSVSTFLKNKNMWQKLVICITMKKLSSLCILTAKLLWWCKLTRGYLHSDVCILTIPNVNISLGCGEHLVRTILARECSCALQTEDAHQALLETMQNKFIGEYLPKCHPTLLKMQVTLLNKDIYSCFFSVGVLCFSWLQI